MADLRAQACVEFGSCWEAMPIILAGRPQSGFAQALDAVRDQSRIEDDDLDQLGRGRDQVETQRQQARQAGFRSPRYPLNFRSDSKCTATRARPRLFTHSPIFGQAVERAEVFIKSIVSLNRAVRKILTGTS